MSSCIDAWMRKSKLPARAQLKVDAQEGACGGERIVGDVGARDGGEGVEEGRGCRHEAEHLHHTIS